MLTGPPKALEIAQQVLELDTIKEIAFNPGYNYHGWRILDRWAMNDPEKLKALETSKNGVVRLMMRLLKQQNLEFNLLMSDHGLELQRNGLAAHEILAMHEINTEL